MTFTFEIAIPSFNRPHRITTKALAMLDGFGVPKSMIRIFLRDEEQKNNYNLQDYNVQLTGQSGILATRNYLQVYYHEQTNLDGVVFIDDDITDFHYLGQPIDKPFLELMTYFFEETLGRKGRLWGINTTANTFFMKDKITEKLKYILGGFKGLVLDRTKDTILCDVGHFEDIQFSLEYYLEDNVVVRFDGYGIKHKPFELIGGICGHLGGLEARRAEMKTNGDYLLERYGDMLKINPKPWGQDLRVNFAYKNIEY